MSTPCDAVQGGEDCPFGLRGALVRRVLAAVGIAETGPNRGPEVDAWLAAVGLAPGEPWCAAFLSAEGAAAAGATGARWPLGRTGRVAVLVHVARAEGLWHEEGDGEPGTGDLEVYARPPGDPRHGGDGHVAVRVPGGVVSGNDGDAVRLRDRAPWPRVGWISLGPA